VRNDEVGIDLKFTTKDAQVKLKKLYPTIVAIDKAKNNSL